MSDPHSALPPNVRTLRPQRELDENGYEYVYTQAQRERARRDLIDKASTQTKGAENFRKGIHITNGVIGRRRGRIGQAFDSVNSGPLWWRYTFYGSIGAGVCLALILYRKTTTSWIKEWILGVTGPVADGWAASANEYAAGRFHYNDPNSRWKKLMIK